MALNKRKKACKAASYGKINERRKRHGGWSIRAHIDKT